jgi:hypothetical protein
VSAFAAISGPPHNKTAPMAAAANLRAMVANPVIRGM